MRRRLARYADFPIKKQGELDSACGLYCVVTAAIRFGIIGDDATGAAHALAYLRDGAKEDYATKLLVGWGVRPGHLLPLVNRMRLKIDPQGAMRYEQLLEPYDSKRFLWVVMIKMAFEDPLRQTNVAPADHYVLVLEASKKAVIVADPHPWHDDIYSMRREKFENCWDQARPRRWGGRLMGANA